MTFSARTGTFCVAQNDKMAISGSKSSTLAQPRQRLWKASLMRSMEYLLCLSSLLESCRAGKVNSYKDIDLFWSSPFRITKFVTLEGTVKLFLRVRWVKSSAKVKCSPRAESWHLLSPKSWDRITDWEKYQKLTRENFWTVGQFCFAPINSLHLPCSTCMQKKKEKTTNNKNTKPITIS